MATKGVGEGRRRSVGRRIQRCCMESEEEEVKLEDRCRIEGLEVA